MLDKHFDSDYEIRLAQLGVLGGDITKHYDSVYAIDLAILELMQNGINAVKEVDVLPDAEANKNKMFRLSTDKKVYVVEGTDETIEVVAPDSEQVGVAYIEDDGGTYYYFTGVQCTITDGETTVTAYSWLEEGTDSRFIMTVHPASQISNIDDESIYMNGNLYYWDDSNTEDNIHFVASDGESIDILPLEGEGWTINDIVMEEKTITTWEWAKVETTPVSAKRTQLGDYTEEVEETK